MNASAGHTIKSKHGANPSTNAQQHANSPASSWVACRSMLNAMPKQHAHTNTKHTHTHAQLAFRNQHYITLDHVDTVMQMHKTTPQAQGSLNKQ
jgi:hypothetical protein